MVQTLRRGRLLAGMGAAALVLAACGGSDDPESSTGDTGAASGDRPSWCGEKEIVLGMTDGFGGNSWRLVTTNPAGRTEKRPSVTEFLYADGQGDTQKAIADIQSMVAQGVNALVVFPDAGEACCPPCVRIRGGCRHGSVPGVPGRRRRQDYTAYIGLDTQNDGRNWANWITEVLPDGGSILFLSGPAGNSQGEGEAEGLHEVLDPLGKYTFIGEQPFEVTNWDPAETQKVLTAAIAKYPEIDVIVSDFGPSLVGALPAFTDAGKSIPPIATSDGNVLGCFWQDNRTPTPTSSCSRSLPETIMSARRCSTPSPRRPEARCRTRRSTSTRSSRTPSMVTPATSSVRRICRRHLPVRRVAARGAGSPGGATDRRGVDQQRRHPRRGG